MNKLVGILLALPYCIGTPAIWAWPLAAIIITVRWFRAPMRPMPMRTALHHARRFE